MAEKLHAAVELGMANTRMKDFYDLDWLCENMAFGHDVLGVGNLRQVHAAEPSAASRNSRGVDTAVRKRS